MQRECLGRATRREKLDPSLDVLADTGLGQTAPGHFFPLAGTGPPPLISLRSERVADQVAGAWLFRDNVRLFEPLLEVGHQRHGRGHRFLGLLNIVVEPGQRLLGNRLPQVRNAGPRWQADLLGFDPATDHLGDARCDLTTLVRRLVVAANVELGGGIAVTVEDPGHAGNVHPAGPSPTSIDGHLHRLKNIPVPVIFVVPDRVIGVVVTLHTGHRHCKKGLGRVFDRVTDPLLAAIGVAIPDQEPGGPQAAGIERNNLVTGQHFHRHPLVALVGIQRFHHPVPPVPDVLLAEPDLALEPVPVAVTPDIQPVAPPPLAVMRAGQQSIHRPGISIRRLVGQELGELFTRWGQSDQVQAHPSQQHTSWCDWLRSHSSLLLPRKNEGINRVLRPFSLVDLRHRRSLDHLIRPVISWILGCFSLRGHRTCGNPCPEHFYLGLGETGPLGGHSSVFFGQHPLQQQAGCGLARSQCRSVLTAL